MRVARLPRLSAPRLPKITLPGIPNPGALLDMVRGRQGPGSSPDGHPSDPSALAVEAVGLGAYVAALPVGLAGLIVRRAPIPVEVSAVVGLAESEPRIRRVLQDRLGKVPADIGVTIASAGVQALAFGPLGIIGGIAHHGAQLADLTARRSAWLRRAGDWEQPREPDSRHDDAGPRPSALRPGPIERYASVAETAALGLGGIALFTPASRRASALAVAALPRAAQVGRDAFCARLGRGLAERDIVVLDRGALWRLDRVDTILVDARVLESEGAPARGAVDLLRAADESGALVVLAGDAPDGVHVPEGRQVDGTNLARAVRELQGDGGCVLVVAAQDDGALAAGDVSVGIVGTPGVPWAGDILAGPDLDDAALVIEASGAARAVSHRSVQIAAAASGVAGLLATTRRGAGAPQIARTTVSLATLGAFGWASTRGNDVARRPRPLRADNTPWHELEAEQALDRLQARSDGLAEAEVANRQNGDGQVEEPSGLGFERALAEEVSNPLTPVMAAGAGISAAVGSVVDAVMVGTVLAANALVGAAQRMHTDRALSRLEEREAEDVSVLRGGDVVRVQVEELVPGDVLVLEPGNVIPADGRLIEADALEVDESSLTGESFPVDKSVDPTDAPEVADRRSMVYAGTSVAAGSGRAVVIAVGPMTEANRSVHEIGGKRASEVDSRLDRLTGLITPIALASAGLVVGTGFLRGRPLRQTLGSAVGIAVAAVPEGLPFVSTVAELAAARRLSERNALVRDPKTIEALGRVDVLCFDKTGTLTEGEIELQRVSDGDVDESVDHLSDQGRALLAAALRASPLSNGDEPLAHATDNAVVKAGERAHVDPGFGLPEWKPVAELPFEPERGFHAVRGVADDRALVCVKGAPEVVLERCASWRRGDDVVSLEDGERQEAEAVMERVASDGYRVLAVAERDGSNRDELVEDDIKDLELLGFVALADRIRETAAEAVETARRAGIGVIMITGDHPATAEAVARELGADNGRVIVGSDIENMRDDELQEAAEGAVFARVTPAHKVQIVEALQRGNRVVAMTGDGANDAPAIRLADVGMALGRRGTPAARDAADVVITDDALETIIDAIVEGRAVWASVRDALGVLVGGNLGEIGFTVATGAVTGVSALEPRQILLVNMMTDLLPAMAIAVRPPVERSPERLLREGPESSLKEALTADIVLRGVTTAAGATSAWIAARVTGRAHRASTVGLLALVGTQLGQTLITGGANPSIIGTVAGSSALLAATVQTPGVSQFFGCTPVGPVGWGIAVGASAAATGASVVLRPLAERLLPGQDPKSDDGRGDRGESGA
jgi:cation-transporting P-type ATPase I